MKKALIIDSRMREIEKSKLTELGYELIELKQSKKVYRQLLQYYHPDHNSNYPTQYLEKLNWLNH